MAVGAGTAGRELMKEAARWRLQITVSADSTRGPSTSPSPSLNMTTSDSFLDVFIAVLGSVTPICLE